MPVRRCPLCGWFLAKDGRCANEAAARLHGEFAWRNLDG